MLLLMLMLSVFDDVACDACVVTAGDACAYVVISGNDVVAAISTIADAFNLFFTRTYMCTRTLRAVRM